VYLTNFSNTLQNVIMHPTMRIQSRITKLRLSQALLIW